MNISRLLRLAFATVAFSLVLAPCALRAADAETFEGTEKVRPPAESNFPANARVVRLRLDESLEVFSYTKKNLLRDRDEEAFYLPPEATKVVQLFVEMKGGRRVYVVKAHNIGETVGGVVRREWLDKEGFRPRDSADEARIQSAIKAHPVIFIVEHAPAPDRDSIRAKAEKKPAAN